MFEIRPLSDTDLVRLAEIDVSESGSVVYTLVHGELCGQPEVWQRPRWDAAAWRRKYEEWQRTLKMDLLLGAFDGERLVGMASAQALSVQDRNQRRLPGVRSNSLCALKRLGSG